MNVPSAAPVVTDEDIQAVTRVLRSGVLANGPEAGLLEEEFAALCGARWTVAVANGSVALYLSAMATGLKSGDLVLVPAFTFAATANAFLVAGCRVQPIDIDAETLNMSPDALEAALKRGKPRAVVIVDLYGSTAGTDDILTLARNHGCIVIEDACHAHGARTKTGEFVGNRADLTVFSLYATKNLAAGEGGLITANDRALVDLLLGLRNHGGKSTYHHSMVALNHRLAEMEAALARSQLGRLFDGNLRRLGNAEQLETWCQAAWGESVRLPVIDRVGGTHVFHQYTVRFSAPALRDSIATHLRNAAVDVRIFYPYVIGDLPGVQPLETPEAVRARESVLSLPVHPGLTGAQKDQLRAAIASTTEL